MPLRSPQSAVQALSARLRGSTDMPRRLRGCARPVSPHSDYLNCGRVPCARSTADRRRTGPVKGGRSPSRCGAEGAAWLALLAGEFRPLGVPQLL